MAAKSKAKPKGDERELLSMRAYARRRGCSHTAVAKAKADGRLVDSIVPNPTGKGFKIDPELADREWTDNTLPQHERGASSKRRSNSGSSEEEEEGLSSSSIRERNARKTDMQVRLLEIKYLEQAGALVDAKKVQSLILQGFKSVRDALATMPDRLAPELAGVDDELLVRARIDEEIRAALNVLSEGKLW